MDPAVTEAIPMEQITAAMDAQDPFVIVLTWVLVWAVRKWAKDRLPKVRHMLPFIAVLLAIAVRAAMEASAGLELSWATVGHGLAAAGVAVLTHSQGREIKKVQDRAREAKEALGATPLGPDDRPDLGPDAMVRPEEPGDAN